ncbi:aldo/keto reductase [Corynebacterium sp. sy039]|uniref:aldo/keto reductase n=1 Tax=Corynebacterium sp. sy039 TaxID=2599641 RepID=UPI0011B75141|nr:aldo/keto reductase [Corynebacterium sp. sy039]QDZ42717.1 aldo/keto reductase [Corynebacterium sp. sy039]
MLQKNFFAHRAGLGCMGYSWGYSLPGQLDDEHSIRSIRQAYDAGVRHFDTSDMYGSGHNETLLSRALEGLHDVCIATKGGIIVDSMEPLSMHLNGAPEYISAAIDNSLKRLGRDHIELYYLHRVDPNTPIEETMTALARAQQQGKIGAIGVSEPDAQTLSRALDVVKIDVVQSELSVWTRDPLKGSETETSGAVSADSTESVSLTKSYESNTLSVMELCAANDIKFVAFSPLGRGFLTGKLDVSTLKKNDFRQWMPRFQDEARKRNQNIVDTLTSIAQRHGAHPSQVALAWVYAQGENVYAIPGSRKIEHVRQNMEAEKLTLSNQEIAEITAVPLPQESRY